ncbi:Endonuclease/exonuclease/phosphatase [Multifurca ochricompacta]|uniref:Endonuclease/exonuclease/phosphatase n=1 Tax=Multifurca ochricompacta TaxID=376703 RepID=A0AAD4M762_9AGAM|nr:Endonuclease/exonuclease/phosphatase [Multifurca ochricompacta]
MTDTVVQVRAIWFTSSGQWEYAPQAPYDSEALYATDSLPTSLTLITWNVDFAAPNVTQRLTAALNYLQFHAFPDYKGGQPPPCLILLQEIAVGAFGTLLAHPWVRAWFMVVPGDPVVGWPRHATYGTVTLVARSAPLVGSICVHFGESRMWRNALVTDVAIGGEEPRARVLRVVNTHLESLPQGTSGRVIQMEVIADLLKDGDMWSGIVCGDMNAIAPSDETLAEVNGLSDAWELRENMEEDGVTWGHQPRCVFPPGRLDKILYTRGSDLKIKNVRRVAVGVEIPSGGWVSDHYGLACQVEV